MNASAPTVSVDTATGALTISRLTLENATVTAECRRWSSGHRGEPVDLDQLSECDLTAFAVQALTVGATAMSAAGDVQQRYGIETLVAEVEQRTSQASQDAAERTTRAVTEASAAFEKVSEQTRRASEEISRRARHDLSNDVNAAFATVKAQLAALFDGEDPTLLARLQPVLDGCGRSIEERTSAQTTKMLDNVVRQFNPADPASPMAQQIRALNQAQAGFAQTAAEQQKLLLGKVEELLQQLAAKKATEIALSASTQKGAGYEQQVHELMRMVAAGLGDEYVETGTVTGLRTRSKKGDGLLSVAGGDVRVVLEMTDSSRSGWSSYLQAAEENRAALASLGLVRSPDQLSGHSVVTLGARRIVLAFDPETDDPELLRVVVQLLRHSAQSAAARASDGEVAAADEAMSEALAVLVRLDSVKRAVQDIRKGAEKIDNDAVTLKSELTRLLIEARSALSGVNREVRDGAA